MDKTEIGILIRNRRLQLNVKQQELADLAGIGINTLVAIERGVGNPRLDTLLTIIETLGLRLDFAPRLTSRQ